MTQHQSKPPRPPTLSPKLQLLQSNLNRVRHQHEALLQLLSDQDKLHRFRHSIKDIQQTVDRYDRCRERVEARQGGAGGLGLGFRWATSEGKYEAEVRQVQSELYRIREQLSRLKKEQSFSSKSRNTHLQQKLLQVKQKNVQQLENLRKNVGRYLANVKQEINIKNQERIMEFANGYLREQAEPYCNDIEADIGMLICELEYESSRRERQQIEKQAQELQKGQTGPKTQQLNLGILERTLTARKLASFQTQTHKRILHECHLLRTKLDLALECIKQTTKSKHKSLNISQKYEEQLQEFRAWLHRIHSDKEGMRMRVAQLRNKIRILDWKIRSMDDGPRDREAGEQNGAEENEREKEMEMEIQKAYNGCWEGLDNFSRLKLEFICNMG